MHKKTMKRRQLLGWLGGGAAATLLVGCGGGSAGPDDALGTLNATALVGEQADASRRDGMVGAVYGLLTAADSALLRGAAGLTKLSGGQAIVGSETFGIGSNTKAMTAALAAVCVERGLLRWDSRPAELLPELSAQQNVAYQAVTLAHLLDHRGGVAAFTGEDDLLGFETFLQAYDGALPGDTRGRRRFFVGWLLAQQPPAGIQPGRDFHYSNAGYALAAAMLEAASGKAFEALFDELLAKPLQMALQWSAPSGIGQPQGHVGSNMPQTLQAFQPLPAVQQVWLDVLAPAGAARLTADAYAGWLRWHLQALKKRSTPLPVAYVSRLSQLAEGDYALGWIGGLLEGMPILAHNGADEGFMSIAALRRDGSRAAFGFTNTFAFRDDGSSWVLDSFNRSLIALMKA